MRAKFGRGPAAVSKKVSFNFISRLCFHLHLIFPDSVKMVPSSNSSHATYLVIPTALSAALLASFYVQFNLA